MFNFFEAVIQAFHTKIQFIVAMTEHFVFQNRPNCTTLISSYNFLSPSNFNIINKQPLIDKYVH